MVASPPPDLLTSEQSRSVKEAIVEAERHTSAEIKVHIDKECPGNVLEKAVAVFNKLGMQKTDLRNGILIYLAIQDRKFAILGDAGINALVPDNFWDDIKASMQLRFRAGHFDQGLIEGVQLCSKELHQHFPYDKLTDRNELSDDISFGT
jgi:uncharacterized membrane protein